MDLFRVSTYYCLRDGPLFFYWRGGYLFRKKTVRKLQLAEKNCLLQGYELKKIVCKAKGNFLEYIDISKF